MGRIVTVTVPEQKFVTDLDDFDGNDWNDDEIYDYVVHQNLSDGLKYDWEVSDK